MNSMEAFVDRLETPVFLVAMPQILDPFFNRSVVLLLEHKDEGSFGMVVNRPTELVVASIMEQFEVSWNGEPGENVWFGGPVQPQLGTLLFGMTSWPAAEHEGVIEVVPGLHLSQDSRVIKRLAPEPPERFRLILGYAGWGPGQLGSEIDRNDWLLAPLDVALVFSREPGEVWAQALRSIGVRPESLPSWVPANGPEREN